MSQRPKPCRIIPVLDLLGGVVVRGVAGKREEYRPIASRLTASSEAIDVARAIRSRFDLSEIYLADLDAIVYRRPNHGRIRTLADDGFSLWVDAGLRSADEANSIVTAGAVAVVAGLETLSGPEELSRLCERYGSERVVFSLDLKSGFPLGNLCGWKSPEPTAIAEEAVRRGIQRMIVLDLAAVGVAQGICTLPLCGSLRRSFPDLELITGGGVRGPADLRELRAAQIDGALVASALHDGRLEELKGG